MTLKAEQYGKHTLYTQENYSDKDGVIGFVLSDKGVVVGEVVNPGGDARFNDAKVQKVMTHHDPHVDRPPLRNELGDQVPTPLESNRHFVREVEPQTLADYAKSKGGTLPKEVLTAIESMGEWQERYNAYDAARAANKSSDSRSNVPSIEKEDTRTFGQRIMDGLGAAARTLGEEVRRIFENSERDDGNHRQSISANKDGSIVVDSVTNHRDGSVTKVHTVYYHPDEKLYHLAIKA